MSDKWKPISLTRQLAFSGGYLTRAYTLETKEIETLAGTQTFVKIEKQAEWLYKAAAGKTATKQSLRRTKLLEDLKERLVKTNSAAFGQIQHGAGEALPKIHALFQHRWDKLDTLAAQHGVEHMYIAKTHALHATRVR